MIREVNLGAALIIDGWLGLHQFDDGEVYVMRRSEIGGWFPTRKPTDEDIETLLKAEAISELDYGRPTLLDRLRGRKTKRPLDNLKLQLADLLEKRKQNLDRLNAALIELNNKGKS